MAAALGCIALAHARATTIVGSAESRLNFALTNNGTFTGGKQDGQTQNTTVRYPDEINDYLYSPVPYGTGGWSWQAVTTTTAPSLGAVSKVTGDVRTQFPDQGATGAATMNQFGFAFGEIAMTSTPDPISGATNMVESHFSYLHYLHSQNASSGAMTIEPGSFFRAALSANAGSGDNVRVISSGGTYGQATSQPSFPFFDFDAEIADGGGALDWMVGGPLSYRASGRGGLFLNFWDGMDGGDASKLVVEVVGGLVTSASATGSFVAVQGLPGVGGSADFTLTALPAISLAWTALAPGSWTFQYDTGGHVELNSNAAVPEPTSLACMLMGTAILLGSHARRRRKTRPTEN